MVELNTIKNIEKEFDSSLRLTLLKFVMLFNVFEHNELKNEIGNKQNLSELSKKYNEIKKIDKKIIKDFLDFFTIRYIKNGELTDDFNNLFRDFEKCDDEISLLKSYTGKIDDYQNLMFLSLRISYRFRDNLYHGNKVLSTLSENKECFEKINVFLFSVLKQLHDKEDVNYEQTI